MQIQDPRALLCGQSGNCALQCCIVAMGLRLAFFAMGLRLASIALFAMGLRRLLAPQTFLFAMGLRPLLAPEAFLFAMNLRPLLTSTALLFAMGIRPPLASIALLCWHHLLCLLQTTVVGVGGLLTSYKTLLCPHAHHFQGRHEQRLLHGVLSQNGYRYQGLMIFIC